MSDKHLHRLTILATVADAGGIAAAARSLGLAKSSVSHHLAEFEREIGTKVLARVGRGIALTPLGEALAAHGRAIRREMDAATVAVRAMEQPQGRLRLSMPAGIADALLLPMLATFLRAYPGIAVDVIATDQLLDLESERLDAAFRIGGTEDARFVARRLHEGSDIFVAAPSYLGGFDPIVTLADAARHPWIGFSRFGLQQVFAVDAPDGGHHELTVQCRVTTTAGLTIKHWAMAGLGLARLPAFAVRDELADGRLAEVLPGYIAGHPVLYLAYMPERFRPANVRRLIDHARAYFAS